MTARTQKGQRRDTNLITDGIHTAYATLRTTRNMSETKVVTLNCHVIMLDFGEEQLPRCEN